MHQYFKSHNEDTSTIVGYIACDIRLVSINTLYEISTIIVYAIRFTRNSIYSRQLGQNVPEIPMFWQIKLFVIYLYESTKLKRTIPETFWLKYG